MIQINEVDVTEEIVEYTCFGLGSCIGLFVTDRTRGINGAAHIPLPQNEGGNENFQDAERLIRLLLKGFEIKGSDLLTLRAKLAGGSTIYNSAVGLGTRNIEAVINFLVANRIYIASTDLGGTVSRTARYDSKTGTVHIRTSEKKSYFI